MISLNRLFLAPWTAASQAPLSMKFSRQESWSGWPFPFSGDLPDLGIKPWAPALQVDSLLSEPPEKPKPSKGILKITKVISQVLTGDPSCQGLPLLPPPKENIQGSGLPMARTEGDRCLQETAFSSNAFTGVLLAFSQSSFSLYL